MSVAKDAKIAPKESAAKSSVSDLAQLLPITAVVNVSETINGPVTYEL